MSGGGGNPAANASAPARNLSACSLKPQCLTVASGALSPNFPLT